jgi:hypothetical protein
LPRLFREDTSEHVGAHRRTEEISLGGVAALAAEKFQLVSRLDDFARG